MTKAAIWSLIIIATGVVIAGFCFFKETFIQIIVAVLLFMGISGMARWILKKAPRCPRWAAGGMAVLTFLAVSIGGGAAISGSLMALADNAAVYAQRIDGILSDLYYGSGGSGAMPTLRTMLAGMDSSQAMAKIARGVQSVASNSLFIMIYMGFMLAASMRVTGKLDRLFADPAARAHFGNVIGAIRNSMEHYMRVQTALGLVAALVTYVTLLVLGVSHPLFWASLAFLLNYIPTVGPMIAVALPAMFCIVETGNPLQATAVGLSLAVWHALIGRFFRRKMMSKSLNLSSFVVLLALQIWGAVWGLAGAFLAVPLTVMLMIVLAQFQHSRWIAVLLSADGAPPHLADDPQAETLPPSHATPERGRTGEPDSRPRIAHSL